ncbi:DUF2799 domain-containing protein [Hoeflea sp. EC-HK425]|jgi:hypothetical protein|uniref:DUF2799 domain-containing protein n=1 Tax=Hoeflea sp. EC-HK425 TaxID=2038388 RepID=UPI00125A43CA|nr:DUF2799 domain-containing protein [Hoeflea sp. EC-HK425]VVT03396.1 conserved exported hypothetical protein [Hoeflea sp. EC-HK425]
MRLYSVLALLACLVLASCQTMSKEECAVADWRVIGEQDGAAGYNPQDRFARHVKACTRAGVAADQTAWYQGYQQGLPRYCTPLNGLSVGSQGKTYANVCPVNLETGFREGYELGRLHHEKKREISSRESRIRSLEQSIRDDEKLLAEGTEDRRAVERRIDDNRRTIRDLDRDIGRMESDLRRIEDDMEDFRYRVVPFSQG